MAYGSWDPNEMSDAGTVLYTDQIAVVRGRDVYKGEMSDIKALPATVEAFAAARPIVLADQGKTLLHSASDNNARAVTLPDNAVIAFPVGAAMEIVNLVNVVTLTVTTDSIYLAGTGVMTDGVTIAANGWCKIKKITSVIWLVEGTGVADATP